MKVDAWMYGDSDHTNMATPSRGSRPHSGKVILAASIATSLLGEVREGLSKLAKRPVLVGFLANDDPAARMYADWTGKTCREK